MTYTAEDFKNANIAIRGTLHAAHRAEPETTLPWVYGDNVWNDDKGMVENGWRPIHESPLTLDTPREANGRRDRDTYIKHIEEQDRVIRARNKRIAELMAALPENRTIPEHTPLTLDTLREAYEQAEVPTKENPVRKGDVLIRKDDDAAIDVWECQTGHHPAVGETRILSRAPREPWADLADVLGDFAIHDHDGREYPEVLARRLHGRGVRVTGGDEK